MDKTAITAISNISREGFISASLHRLGWRVIHRATSLQGLKQALELSPEALLITSTDFKGSDNFARNQMILIDFERYQDFTQENLQDLLHNIEKPQMKAGGRITATTADLVMVASFGRSVGASTLALNIAQEISSQDLSTLLIDGNTDHPYLSRQLSLHGVDREILRTSLGFAAFEITEARGAETLGDLADSYHRLVLDFGQLVAIERLLHGCRMRERLFSWALRSKCNFILVSKCDERSLAELIEGVTGLSKLEPSIKIRILLIPQQAMGSREGARLERQLSETLKVKVRVLIRDLRAVAVMEERNTTLAISSPKSALRSEIAEVAKELESTRKELAV